MQCAPRTCSCGPLLCGTRRASGRVQPGRAVSWERAGLVTGPPIPGCPAPSTVHGTSFGDQWVSVVSVEDQEILDLEQPAPFQLQGAGTCMSCHSRLSALTSRLPVPWFPNRGRVTRVGWTPGAGDTAMQRNRNRCVSYQVISAPPTPPPRKHRCTSRSCGKAPSMRNEVYVHRTANITANFQRKLPLSIKAALSQTCIGEEDPHQPLRRVFSEAVEGKPTTGTTGNGAQDEKEEPPDSTDVPLRHPH